jgi:general secretion pathway protein F
MIRVGEASGTIDIVLERLADFSEKQQALKMKVRSALAYPILMSIIGTFVLFFMMTFIVPNITRIFNEMHQRLPWITIPPKNPLPCPVPCQMQKRPCFRSG